MALLPLLVIAPAAGRADLDESTVSRGAGGAYRSVASGASAFSLNPAGIGGNPGVRSVRVHSHFNDSAKQWALSATLLDGKSRDPIHWGFQFFTFQTDELKSYEYRVGAAANLWDLVILGITQRLIDYESGVGVRDRFGWSTDAGVILKLGDHIGVGGAVRNAYRREEIAGVNDRVWSGGVSLNFMFIRLLADLERVLKREITRVRGGVEVAVNERFIVRAGYFRGTQSSGEAYSLGTSAPLIPELSNLTVDLAFEDFLNEDRFIFSGGIACRF